MSVKGEYVPMRPAAADSLEKDKSTRDQQFGGKSVPVDDRVNTSKTRIIALERPGSPIKSHVSGNIASCPGPDTECHADAKVPCPTLSLSPIEFHENESPYISFFLSEAKLSLPYFEIFPNMANEIFAVMMLDRGLFHAVLSVSHFIVSSRLRHSPFTSFLHERQAVALLHQSLSAKEITEALVISLSLLAWKNIIMLNPKQSCQLLQVLYRTFWEIRNPSPLLIQVWHASKRLNTLASILFYPRIPAFPLIPENEDNLRRKWIQKSILNPDDRGLISAAVSLDSLMNRVCHVAIKAYELRGVGNDSEPQILVWTSLLFEQHAQWCEREIVTQSRLPEDGGGSDDSDGLIPDPTSSPDYPVLQPHMAFTKKLLMMWHGIYILIDLISSPDIQSINRRNRYKHALEICRHCISMGRGAVSLADELLDVFLAGLGFGGNPGGSWEIRWLSQAVLDPSLAYFPLNQLVIVTTLLSVELRI